MTFEEILDQAIAMLQRRGRVSYRTLTLQFHLDESRNPYNFLRRCSHCLSLKMLILRSISHLSVTAKRH